VACQPLSGDANLGCSASIEVPFGTAAEYSVEVDGVEDASGSLTADETGGKTSSFAFASDNLLHVASPDWPEQIIFFLMTDRYANGDPSNDCIDDVACNKDSNAEYSGGDFQGIIQELEYIKGMGATAIWLTPPVANQWWDPLVNFGGYHGYWQENITETDAHYGTLNDYKLLSDTLHRNDMYLVQDVVVNHTGNFFSYPGGTFNPDDPAENCIRNVNSDPVGATPTQPPLDLNNCLDPAETDEEIYHFTPQILDFNDPVQEKTWALSDLDDLATENQVVRDFLKDAFGYWITEVGVDAFRIDTVKFVEEDFYADWVHSDDLDHPGLTKSAESVGRLDFLDFGEVFEASAPFGTKGEEKIASYLGTDANPLLQANLQFPLYQENLNVIANGQPTSQMRFRLEAFMNPEYFKDPFVTPTFLDNHDVARWLTSGNRDSLKQGLMFLMTIPGIPVIYMGTAQEFTETRQAMFADGFAAQGMDWYDTSTEMYQLIAELTDIRKTTRVLTRGDLTVLSENAQSVGGLTYFRNLADDGTQAMVFMNTADEPILISGVDTGLEPGTRLTLVKSLVAGDNQRIDAEGQIAIELDSRDMLLYSVAGVGNVPDPGVDIEMDNPPNGATFDEPFTLTGTVTGNPSELVLVIDELVERATPVDITPGSGGGSDTWSVDVPLEQLAVNDRLRKLVVYDPDSGATSITDTFVSTFIPPSATVSVQDPEGDDAGPDGVYTYPTDPSFFGEEGDLLNIEASAAGRNMTLTLTMKKVQDGFASPVGFDHVSFNIFFDAPGIDGITVLPELDAEAPMGFAWDFQHRVYGFGEGLHSSENADEDFRGETLTGAPQTEADKDAGTIAFTYDADDFGLTGWTGVRVYVTVWDIDGLEDVHRPLTATAEPFTFGGRQADDDDLVLDDAEIIEIPPPPE
jgi:glycosidase